MKRRPFLADWRQVRAWEHEQRTQLRKRHALWLHGWCIGLLVLGTMWATSHGLMLLGLESLALRYLVTLGAGYLAFLAVLRVWAGMLVGEEPEAPDAVDAVDVGSEVADAALEGLARRVPAPDLPITSGGGDFGGAGAQADFGEVADAGGSLVGDVAGGALEAAGSADEGAVVVVPVVAVFVIGCLVVFGFGSLLLTYFGWEVLTTAAVEIAFSYVSARTAVRVVREGWLLAAVRLTWKPLLGALVCAVALGAMLDYFVPQARSLPHAVQLMRGR
jgi:hypothetical protein